MTHGNMRGKITRTRTNALFQNLRWTVCGPWTHCGAFWCSNHPSSKKTNRSVGKATHNTRQCIHHAYAPTPRPAYCRCLHESIHSLFLRLCVVATVTAVGGVVGAVGCSFPLTCLFVCDVCVHVHTCHVRFLSSPLFFAVGPVAHIMLHRHCCGGNWRTAVVQSQDLRNLRPPEPARLA